MPQAIIGALTAVGASVGVATVVAYGVTLIGTIALSNYQKRKAERAQRAQWDAAQVDRMVNMQTTVMQRELMLGRVRKGGGVYFRASAPPYNAVFVCCVTLAAHEIDGVERIYFNDQPIDLDADGNVTTAPWGRTSTESAYAVMSGASVTLPNTPIAGSISVVRSKNLGSLDFSQREVLEFQVSGQTITIDSYDPSWNYEVTYQWTKFLSVARVYIYNGSPNQTANPRLMSLFPGTWTPAHRARGVAYLEVEFVYEESAFPSGLPNVTALARGAKLYDPRDGQTRFSENPALMMRYVLTHPQFGRRTSISAAEDARIASAANACDHGFSYTGSDWVSLYRAATVVPFGTAPRDVLDDLAQAMGGEWAYSAGDEFFVHAGVYWAPLMTLTEDDLAVVQRGPEGEVSQSPITISPHRPRNDKVNTVAARIWDQAANYVMTPITPFRADALVAADGGVELSREVTMAAVFYAPQAYHIAGIMLRDSRDPLTVTLPFKLKAYPLEIFDVVRLSIARYGWSNKEFRVLGRVFHPADGYVTLTLKETTAAIYQYGAGFVPGGYADNTNLPNPWDIRAPNIKAIYSGESELIVQSDGTVVNSVRVVWDQLQQPAVTSNGTIEVSYRVVPYWDWGTITVPGNATEARIPGPEDGAIVIIKARARNSLAVSDWSLEQSHVVVGKTEPPPNIERFSISGSVLSWSLPRRVPDLAGFVFRFHYGNNVDWNSATPLHTGVITDSPYSMVNRPGGVVTIMGKAVDTTGNQSLAAASIVMNLGDPPIANVLEQWNFEAMGWPAAPGEQSGWTLVGGDPTANALDSFYGTDDQSFYAADTESFYEPGVYSQMVYVTEPVSVSSALAGSIMTLTAQTQGIDLRIEYRLAGPGSFYGPDAASFYGPDADPRFGPPGDWLPWPGQVVAKQDAYQFRVTIGAGAVQGILQAMVLTIDAPDLEEVLADVPIAAAGTTIPYTKPFTSIKSIQATLQVNGSGARTVEINKSAPLAPVIRALNFAGTAVSGATADITIRGY